MLNRLSKLAHGQLTVADDHGVFTFGQPSCGEFHATIEVHSQRFYRSLFLGGSLAAAESYIQGDWDTCNLTQMMRILARNLSVLNDVESGPVRLLQPLRYGVNWLRRNSRTGSRRNISAHYDLSNDLFALMLDPTMTYSSGIFPSPESTMQEASVEKYDRICRKLQIDSKDRVVEIGTGWGGFAEHAARKYGCHITTTTISQRQYEYAKKRFREAGIEDRVTLLKTDYRDLKGSYDKLVSIEMIEAVGEQYLPTYFDVCSRLLKPTGKMCLQAIMMPDDRYDRYRRSCDFIQRYIFPGGFLPSMRAIAEAVGRKTDLRFCHVEDFSPHYAETLVRWRTQFWNEIESIRKLGFDQRFMRTWHYYLCYCEAGFREHQVGVSQLLLTKPLCPRTIG